MLATSTGAETSNTLFYVLGTGIVLVLSTIILQRLNERQRRIDRRQDREERRRERREDKKHRKRVAEEVAEVKTITAENNGVLVGKLDQVHVLVNSNMTAAMRAELDATSRELALMKEVAALHLVAGRAPTPESEAAIRSTEARIAELRANLNDRLGEGGVG